MKLPSWALVLVCTAAATTSLAGDPSALADELIADLERRGAVQALQSSHARQEVLDVLFEQVSAGSEKWLRLAMAYRAVAPAPYSTELDSMVALALREKPEQVLKLLQSQRGAAAMTVASVCDGEAVAYVEHREGAAKEWRAAAEKKLRFVRSKQLQQSRDQCLSYLRGRQR